MLPETQNNCSRLCSKGPFKIIFLFRQHLLTIIFSKVKLATLMQRLLGWSSLSADFRGNGGLTCSDKSDPCLLRDFWSKTTVQRQTSATQEQIKPFRKALPGSLPALPSGKLNQQPAGLGEVSTWRHFLFMFSFTGPTEAVPQLHPHHSGTYLHRHSIPAAHTHTKKCLFGSSSLFPEGTIWDRDLRERETNCTFPCDSNY